MHSLTLGSPLPGPVLLCTRDSRRTTSGFTGGLVLARTLAWTTSFAPPQGHVWACTTLFPRLDQLFLITLSFNSCSSPSAGMHCTGPLHCAPALGFALCLGLGSALPAVHLALCATCARFRTVLRTSVTLLAPAHTSRPPRFTHWIAWVPLGCTL